MKRTLIVTVLAILMLWGGLQISFRHFNLQPPPLPSGHADAQAEQHICEGCSFVKNEFGLWEAYVEGAPFKRGSVLGQMAKMQVRSQEEHFIAQIRRLVPSELLLGTLKYGVSFFNRNMNDHVPLEFREEIHGISRAFDTKNDWIAPAYARVMNYHAAHDIGHALQDLSIVGCTSFAAWESASADSGLIIGRNFDFYMGDDFAQDKMVLFMRPDSGHAFASVTWAGFMGVVSGMNEHGLTVTLNAAKSSVPTGSKTPISILAREILQYARNIDEAYAIAKNRETFVSESILIGSAEDGRAAIIEKSPEAIGLFEADGHRLVCSNHYQSEKFRNDPANLENIRMSDSDYRFRRMNQLLDEHTPVTPTASATMLRDRKGLENAELGMGNPKAINQLLAHHAVIFQPEKRLMWVSTNPFQLGEFVCYDLNVVFRDEGRGTGDEGEGGRENGATDTSKRLNVRQWNIPSDPFLKSKDYAQFLIFKQYKQNVFDFLVFGRGDDLTADEETAFLASNPHSYITHQLLGELYLNRDENGIAADHFRKALSLEVATEGEREWLRKKLSEAGK
ncbi:MAG: C45 family peptidase [Flavobacteriales bacterium]|nr:C45 family peptidase [Flavobacteriales bacterium]